MTEYRFDKFGTLPQPGLIGRLIRILLGLLSLYFIYSMIIYGVEVIHSLSSNLVTWFVLTFAILTVSHVVNIGFGRNWRTKPQTYLIWVLMISIMISLIQEDQVLGWIAVYSLYVFLFYFYIHLGISLVISSIIATPGCEMRSIPHLYTLISGNKTREHFCPGFLDNVDRWERKHFSKAT